MLEAPPAYFSSPGDVQTSVFGTVDKFSSFQPSGDVFREFLLLIEAHLPVALVLELEMNVS